MAVSVCLSASISPEAHVLKSSPYSITERNVPELIPVLGSHPAGDVSHKHSPHAASSMAINGAKEYPLRASGLTGLLFGHRKGRVEYS